MGPGGGQLGPQPTHKALLGEAGAGSLMPRCPQVWEKNRKLKSVSLSALEKHGPVYEDGEAAGWEQAWQTGGAVTAQGSP